MSAYPPTLRPLTPGVSTAAGTSWTVWMPVELVTPIRYGSSSTQVYGIVIVRERRRPSVDDAVDREGHDRVVHRDHRDRDVLGLRVAHEHLDLARRELDPADVERVGRRAGSTPPGR